jgi:hypothetical protein
MNIYFNSELPLQKILCRACDAIFRLSVWAGASSHVGEDVSKRRTIVP